MSASDPQLIPRAGRVRADLDELARLVEDDRPGWTRRAFSEPYREQREFMLGKMRGIGLEARIDPAGNVIGVLPGRNRSLPPLMTGSHTDTVHGGGRYDGIVGVLGALETARLFSEQGIQLERDLIVIDFYGEEANNFGVSCVGSRSISGRLLAEHLDRVDADTGISLGETMLRRGLDPDRAVRGAWRPGSLHGYVELHIEQGPKLERSGSKIGVVTAIAGIERLLARFSGRPDHAGTMPMEERRDALIAAAEAILLVEREGCGAPIHGVSTTGRIESSPGSFNVVPGDAAIWAEMRSVDAEWLDGAKGRLARDIAELAAKRGVDTAIEWLNDQEPVHAARSVQDRIAGAADALGVSWESIPSGAGHDAAHLADLGPMGMVFIPSVGGRSHVPEEFTEMEDVELGIGVLAHTLLGMDRERR
ncbi:M20 family metallo-hydrolase [Leucobacter ruminantium]|uniref:M20 family metallo-hydrolase n=2 Tax=Leucobacter ruminantium TaxID=1289170 RepID=A0A939LX58_9MICO|nr:M20 family metallo-hydrolase [Leucobacter ruminantium]